MKVDTALADKLAALSRLRFDTEAREEIVKDLGAILTFMEKLNELDTEGVEPLIYITDEVNVLRKDEVRQEISKAEALSNAPLHDADHIKVPKVINRLHE
jgi:aspartyl-tRNA(Asn)/glutamyl-tRNA(Gln) amidotransferase subunit C